MSGKINLGLCCINNTLRKAKPTVFNSRTCIRRTYSVEKANELALKNVKDLIPMIEYNHQKGIRCFRLSSDIFPRFTDRQVENYTIDFAKDDLKTAGDLAKKYGIRILMHPGQYNQVGAKDERVFQSTIDELDHHADILEAMGIDNNGVLIVHGGGTYGDKGKTTDRWIDNYFRLPKRVQERLVLENCERQYSIDDVLAISKKVKERGGDLPVVFDSHHYECWNEIYPDKQQTDWKEVLQDVISTWGDRRVVMHVSNQGTGRVGHHSDYITKFPECFRYVAEVLGVSFDLEVEAKAKEAAIFRLWEDEKWILGESVGDIKGGDDEDLEKITEGLGSMGLSESETDKHSVNKTNLINWENNGNVIPPCINTGCDNKVAVRHWTYQKKPSLKTECSRCSSSRLKDVVLNGIIFHKKQFCENSEGLLGFGFECPIKPDMYSKLPSDIYHMDHIDGNHFNNNLENVRTLCSLCHTMKGRLSGDFNSSKDSSMLHQNIL